MLAKSAQRQIHRGASVLRRVRAALLAGRCAQLGREVQHDMHEFRIDAHQGEVELAASRPDARNGYQRQLQWRQSCLQLLTDGVGNSVPSHWQGRREERWLATEQQGMRGDQLIEHGARGRRRPVQGARYFRLPG